MGKKKQEEHTEEEIGRVEKEGDGSGTVSFIRYLEVKSGELLQ
jgi:hypothetical protein